MGLQGLRDSKQSWLIYIVFALIIIVFVFMFGAPSTDMFGATNTATVAKIHDHEMDSELVRSMLRRHYDDRAFQGDAYLPLFRNMMNNLALIYLLADDARANGLRVSDEDWDAYMTNWEAGNDDILTLGFLDRNNNFSAERFQNAVRSQGMSPGDYRKYKENELLARRYLAIMQNSISVSEESAWNMFVEMSQMASIDIIKLSPSAIQKTLPSVTDADIDAYLSAHAADVQKYYDEHLGLYTTPEKIKIQEIIIQTDYSKLTNVGAKTVKTLTSKERYTIARHQVIDEKVDFAQAYADYDEAQTKTESGIKDFQSVDDMTPQYAALFEGVGVGEFVFGELKDRYVIAKILDRTPQSVTPLETVKRDIAKQLITDASIATKMEETRVAMLAMISEGVSLQDAVDRALYANMPAKQPVAKPLVQETETPDAPSDTAVADADTANTSDDAADMTNADAADTTNTANDAVAIAPVQPEANAAAFVPPSERVQVITLPRAKIGASTLDIFMSMSYGNSGYTLSIDGIGESDELVRDIRNAKAGTTLDKAYKINDNLFFVRVVSKAEPDKAVYDVQKESIKNFMTQLKTLQLIGNPEDILNLRTQPSSPRGLWLEQRLKQAEINHEYSVNEKFFANETRQRQARKAKQQEEEQE